MTPTPRQPPLTQAAHHAVGAVLAEGGWALDATAGNGRDTLFLARKAGPGGRVFALDIQQAALAKTRDSLRQAGCLQCVQLHCGGHENLAQILPMDCHHKLDAVMFNLGYLPGGDKTLTTRTENTLRALEQTPAYMRPGGILSVLAYPGHPAGLDEWQAVAAWMQTRAAQPGLSLERIAGSPPPAGPELFLLRYH